MGMFPSMLHSDYVFFDAHGDTFVTGIEALCRDGSPRYSALRVWTPFGAHVVSEPLASETITGPLTVAPVMVFVSLGVGLFGVGEP